MSDKNIVVVQKVIEEIDVARSLMRDVDLDAFLGDEMLKRAVCMTIINIGELVKNLDDGFRSTHSSIPWKAIAGFRDIAAHKYLTLRMEDVYVTAHDDFDELKTMLEEVVEKLGE